MQNSTQWTVVVNDEEQYSVWPADRDVPEGWRAVGVTGPKERCLDHIEEVWVDMRPLSLRRAVEADGALSA
ncbi:MbtH protein [Streptomyces sulfonofaciens]|uniref:MbtH protein n=1 Tax=Streptomyces sulfonofaciens TaxID=68272 RepID=A0A919GIW6_9ACTN|nr:MbtH family NRPS accessory protein [Streptomyces sulfonofaciens]GHH85670.1 MbtH protein [Streptomyces sulfonofaciens]